MKRHLRRAAAIAAILLVMSSAYAFPKLGRFLVAEDPLTKADAIYVLSGARFERILEAVDLYKAGWAPAVLLSTGVYDWGERELRDKGIPYPRESDIQIELMGRLGVPKEAILTLGPQDSTHEEALSLVGAVRKYHWKTVIVVTSKQHTRRARMEMNRFARRDGVTVIMRASRHDLSDVDRWWSTRGTFRFTVFEAQRLLFYWLRLA